MAREVSAKSRNHRPSVRCWPEGRLRGPNLRRNAAEHEHVVEVLSGMAPDLREELLLVVGVCVLLRELFDLPGGWSVGSRQVVTSSSWCVVFMPRSISLWSRADD
jgi:hypothetical protein